MDGVDDCFPNQCRYRTIVTCLLVCFRGGAEVAGVGAGGRTAGVDAQQRRGAAVVAERSGGGSPRCRRARACGSPRARADPRARLLPRLRTRTFQAANDEQQSWVCCPGITCVRNSWGIRFRVERRRRAAASTAARAVTTSLAHNDRDNKPPE